MISLLRLVMIMGLKLRWAYRDGISITAIFPDSQVITGKSAFYAKRDEKKHRYIVLNYDKFSQDDSESLILELVRQKIDLIVLDEVQFIKGDMKRQPKKVRGVIILESC